MYVPKEEYGIFSEYMEESMVLVILDIVMCIASIIILIMFDVKVVLAVLLVISALLAIYIFVRHRAEKKYYMELVEKFDNKLVAQVNDTIGKRVAMELQKADSVGKEKKATLDKRIEESQGFDTNTSIVNGSDIFVELRMLSVRYANEPVKDKCSEYII